MKTRRTLKGIAISLLVLASAALIPTIRRTFLIGLIVHGPDSWRPRLITLIKPQPDELPQLLVMEDASFETDQSTLPFLIAHRESAMPFLLQLLKRKDPSLRLQALSLLEDLVEEAPDVIDLNGPTIEAAMISGLTNGPPTLHENTVDILSDLYRRAPSLLDATDIDLLLELYPTEEDDSVRNNILRCLARGEPGLANATYAHIVTLVLTHERSAHGIQAGTGPSLASLTHRAGRRFSERTADDLLSRLEHHPKPHRAPELRRLGYLTREIKTLPEHLQDRATGLALKILKAHPNSHAIRLAEGLGTEGTIATRPYVQAWKKKRKRRR